MKMGQAAVRDMSAEGEALRASRDRRLASFQRARTEPSEHPALVAATE